MSDDGVVVFRDGVLGIGLEDVIDARDQAAGFRDESEDFRDASAASALASAASAAAAALYDGPRVATFADLEDLTYGSVDAGDLVRITDSRAVFRVEPLITVSPDLDFGTIKFNLVSDSTAEAFGAMADGVTVDTLAIQRAINAASRRGGGYVDLNRPGRYLIDDTLILPSLVILRMPFKSAEIFLADGSDCNMLETFGLAGHIGLNHWYVDTHGIPWGYGLQGVTLNGNKAGNASGMGFVGYGKPVMIDIVVRDCAERGLWHMCGNTRGQHDFRDLPECQFKFEVYDCGTVGDGDHGAVLAGPHDAHYQRGIAASNGVDASHWNVYFFGDGIVAGGGRIVGPIHTYGGTASGVRISGTNAGCQGTGQIIAENGLLVEASGCDLVCQCGSANYGVAIDIKSGGNNIRPGRSGTNHISHTLLRVEGSNNVITGGRLIMEAGSTGTVIYDSGSNNTINDLFVDADGAAGSVGLHHDGGSQCRYRDIYITGADTSIIWNGAGQRNTLDAVTNNATAAKHFVGTPAANDDIRVRGLGSSFSIPAAPILNTTAVGNVGTGSDSLIVVNIPAGAFFRNGVKAKIRAAGTTANNANAKSVSLEFGAGNTIITKSLIANAAGFWEVEADVVLTGADAQRFRAKVLDAGGAQGLENGTATQPTNAAISVRCRGSGTADNDIVQTSMEIEWVA